MTHLPSSHRKKRINECDDFDHMQTIKRARTKSFNDTEIAVVKDVSHSPQSSNLNLSVASRNKQEQFLHHSLNVMNGELERTGMNSQSEMSYVSQEYSAFHQAHFKYLPDLNAIENPHYYENNRLLFELYVERLRRSTCHSGSTSPQF